MTANMTAREDQEQATLFRWAQLQAGMHPELQLLMHIPNGGKRNAAEAARFKAEGVKAGVPDLLLPVARQGKHGLWIELKRRQGGRLSENQSEWLEALSSQGYRTEVCCGWEEASRVLLNYLTAEQAESTGSTVPARKKAKGKGFDFEEWLDNL